MSANFRGLQSSNNSNSTLIIIISVAGGLALVMGVTIVVLLIRKRNRRLQEEEAQKKFREDKSVKNVVSNHFRKSMVADPRNKDYAKLNELQNNNQNDILKSKKNSTLQNEDFDEEPQEEDIYDFTPQEEIHPQSNKLEEEEEIHEIKKKKTNRVTFAVENESNNNQESEHIKETKESRSKRVIAEFTEKLKGLKQKKKQKSILEEIEKMKKKKSKKKQNKNINDDENTQIPEDRSSVHILNTDLSHLSQVSARSIVKKQNHVDIVYYTDENREEPDEFFFNQKMEDLIEEKRQIEIEDEIEMKKEKQIKEKLKKDKIKKIHTKDDSNQDYTSLYKYKEQDDLNDYRHKDTLQVKSQALMTDFSQPKNIEVLKEGEQPSY